MNNVNNTYDYIVNNYLRANKKFNKDIEILMHKKKYVIQPGLKKIN